jgi:hypothetical protein
VLLAPVEEKLAVPIVEAAENHHPSAFAPPSSAGRHGERLGGENARHVAATEEPRRPPPGESDREDDDDADTVGNLEKDMARLLGQISTGRPG